MASVLIIEGGARGHVLAEAYSKSPSVEEIIVLPGNDGMSYITPGILTQRHLLRKHEVTLKDAESILRAAEIVKPDLVDVAQDDALAAGAVDLLTKNGFKAFGPTRAAARIEWDKEWARRFMNAWNIPIPKYETFTKGNFSSTYYAHDIIAEGKSAFFKASGLFGGKGVIEAKTHDDVHRAYDAIAAMGPASNNFLVEEGLVGEEFSYYAILDGGNFRCFPSAQDNKRLYNGNKGPNTGGMGAHSPALVTKGLEGRIESEIIAPTIKGLISEGIRYVGILYVGGMVCEDGSLKVIEFNSRWGDPEVQVVLPGLQNDYFALVNAAISGNLRQTNLKFDDMTRVCIVGTSSQYPGKSDAKHRIFLEPKELKDRDISIYSAGMKLTEGKFYTDGGRLFNVVGKADNVVEAQIKALMAIATIKSTDPIHYRTDIAQRDVERTLKRDEKMEKES